MDILRAKLLRPALPNCYIFKRASFSYILSCIQQQHLTILCAPDGYGKTTLLVEVSKYLEENGNICTWLECDTHMQKNNSFWQHLAAAFTSHLESPHCIGISESDSDQAVDLSNTLFDVIPSNVDAYLFVDQFEQLTDTTLIKHFLRFCTLVPPNLHIVISTNTLMAPMKTVAYQFGEPIILAEKLKLTFSECNAILNNHHMSNYDEQVISDVYQITEGWVRGVHLAAQIIERAEISGTDAIVDGGNQIVREYFNSQIMEKLPADTSNFLVKLALFDRFNKSMLESVFHNSFVVSQFENLLDGNTFIFSCDSTGEWYRLHPLFADMLRHELLSCDRGNLRRLYLAASEWFYRNNCFDEATKYLIMSGDIEYLEGLVEAVCGLVRPQRQTDSFLWMMRVSASDIVQSPLLCMIAAWACVTMARLQDADHWIAAFEHLLSLPENRQVLPKELVSFSTKCLRMKYLAMSGEGERALALCDELQNCNRAISPSLLSMINQSEAESYERIGNYEQAMEHYLKAQASASVDRTIHQSVYNEYSYAIVLYYYGEHEKARQCCETLIERCPPDYAIHGAACALLARILIETDDTQRVQELIEEAEKGLVYYRHIDLYLDIKMSKTMWLFAQGSRSQAFEVITEAVLRGEQYRSIPRMALLSAYYLQAELAARQGNLKELKIIEQKYEVYLRPGDLFNELLLNSIQAYIYELEGDISSALDMLNTMIPIALKKHFSRMGINALVERTLLLHAVGATPQAMESLNELIHIAHRQGYIRSILNAGTSMRYILREFSTKRKAGNAVRSYVKSLLLKFGDNPEDDVDELDKQVNLLQGDYQLTPREIEVLRLLNMGLSRKEIAETLSISINTTKKHLSNIYTKMGVGTREEVLAHMTDRQ